MSSTLLATFFQERSQQANGQETTAYQGYVANAPAKSGTHFRKECYQDRTLFAEGRKKGGRHGYWAEGQERLTFTLQALPQEAPEQGPTVVTECGDLVVVDPKLVGHVDAESLGAHLQGQEDTLSALSSSGELTVP